MTKIDRIVKFEYKGKHYEIPVFKHQRRRMSRKDEEIIDIKKTCIDRVDAYMEQLKKLPVAEEGEDW